MFFALAAGGCALDLWTKRVIFQWRGLPRFDNVWWIWKDYLGIETALNTGALFGMGKDMVWLFAALSVAATIGILYWLFVAGSARDLLLTITLSLITGGILGNLYDRLGLWGGKTPDGETIYAVRDWILISYGGHNLPLLGQTWPNFNIADSLLVCGAALLIWHAFRHPNGPAEEDRKGAADNASSR